MVVPYPKSKSRVKTGCQTCRKRKVKCDEIRPSCRRCLSTGRICDGYGIWGGGGNFYGARSAPLTAEVMKLPWASTGLGSIRANEDEHRHHDWFLNNSLPKLPGALHPPFWDRLLLQISRSEPAVFHAVLALSSAHRREGQVMWEVEELGPMSITCRCETTPDERFTLDQYCKAIQHLKPSGSSVDRGPMRAALVACLLFTHMEYLRGHYMTANTHLNSGIMLLEEMMTPKGPASSSRALQARTGGSVLDAWLVRAFTHLYVQARAYGQTSHNFTLMPAISDLPPLGPNAAFESIDEARGRLDVILTEILFQKSKPSQIISTPRNIDHDFKPRILERKAQVQGELARWLRTWTTTKKSFEAGAAGRERKATLDAFAYRVLHSFHATASIMADTFLPKHDDPPDETIYDAQTGAFLALLSHAVDSLRMVLRAREPEEPAAASDEAGADARGEDTGGKKGRRRKRRIMIIEHSMEVSHSIADVGWIPPLFLIAMKCRVHRIRAHAIRLLGFSPHKEGIWDSEIVVRVATKVMQLEEGSFYAGCNLCHDDFAMDSLPTADELAAAPVLPAEHRFCDVEIVLPEGPLGRLALVCRRKVPSVSGGFEVVETHEYDGLSGSWSLST